MTGKSVRQRNKVRHIRLDDRESVRQKRLYDRTSCSTKRLYDNREGMRGKADDSVRQVRYLTSYLSHSIS